MDTIRRITNKVANLSVRKVEDNTINILLLGETGVGKSTFINALSNYFSYDNFETAIENDLSILIPTLVSVTDENGQIYQIAHGSDKNEDQQIGSAATQYVKTYIFPISNTGLRLRLIDSPGMGDPRGIGQDDINSENILHYLAGLEKLHAICLLMKPNNTRNTALFSYCIKQIFARLDKSTSQNIIFIFTNSRGSNYTPGDTLPCLKRIIDDVKSQPPYVNIPLNENIFSVDNEPFKTLVAMKNNVKFNAQVKLSCSQSWEVSSEECWRLIKYVLGDTQTSPLQPLSMKNTVSVNEARVLIDKLSQPLSDISQLIEDNICLLERHQQILDVEYQSLDELKKQLYIPSVNLKVTELKEPVTVCTYKECADIVKIGVVTKWHYRQRCHDPCYLRGVPKEIIGDPRLLECAAMAGTKTCTKCSCSYALHMHVYYMTEPVEDNIVDPTVLKSIDSKAKAVQKKEQIMKELEQRKNELKQERKSIVEIIAKFAHFLECNAITPFNDSYKEYIEHLIENERGLGKSANMKKINNLKMLLKRHDEIKSTLDNNLYTGREGLVAIKPDNIQKQIDTLYKMKHNGKKIKQLFDVQSTSRKQEYEKSVEYVVQAQINLNRLNKGGRWQEIKQEPTTNVTIKKDTDVEDFRNDKPENRRNTRDEQDNVSLHSIHSEYSHHIPRPNHCPCENCKSSHLYAAAWTPPHYMTPPVMTFPPFTSPPYTSSPYTPQPYTPQPYTPQPYTPQPYTPPPNTYQYPSYGPQPPNVQYNHLPYQREPYLFSDQYRGYSPHHTPNEPPSHHGYHDWRQNPSQWAPQAVRPPRRFQEDRHESNRESFYPDNYYTPPHEKTFEDRFDDDRNKRHGY